MADQKLRDGEYYNKLKAQADVQLIQAKYGYEGYGVRSTTRLFHPGPGIVPVQYEIQERPPARGRQHLYIRQ